MNQPKLSNLVLNKKESHHTRARVAKSRKIKITNNLDQNDLGVLRAAEKNSALQQKLLSEHAKFESRLLRVEKELEKLKKKMAA